MINITCPVIRNGKKTEYEFKIGVGDTIEIAIIGGKKIHIAYSKPNGITISGDIEPETRP